MNHSLLPLAPHKNPRLLLSVAVALGAVNLVSSGMAAAFTVDSVGALDPNPSNLTITEVGNTSLATARTMISAAHTAGTGGTIDFQQQFQGGTFLNSNNATNGVDFATDITSPLQVTASSSGAVGSLVATGPVIFSFYRSDAVNGDPVANDNVDSNLNQGVNVISGGYKSRDPAASGTTVVGNVNLSTVPPTPDPASGGTSISGGYLGITGLASPATFVFDSTPLSFFGITALPRGATRDTLITLTQIPLGGGGAIQVTIGGATVVGTSAVFFGQAANVGYMITGATISNPNGQGQNRYDDLAFIAVPEPGTVGLMMVAGTGLLLLIRRRRAV